MAEDKPRYELHFHASLQAAVVSDYHKVSQLFEDSLTQVNSATVHQFLPNLADFLSRQEELDAVLDLTVITEEEALELLTKLIGVERTQTQLEAAKNIIELCGKLPLAIRITGGTLRNKPEWQLADYALQLAAERQKLIQIRPQRFGCTSQP
ncbi:MAG: NB-ARC domain-containing protein [Potamolinea sp.]